MPRATPASKNRSSQEALICRGAFSSAHEHRHMCILVLRSHSERSDESPYPPRLPHHPKVTHRPDSTLPLIGALPSLQPPPAKTTNLEEPSVRRKVSPGPVSSRRCLPLFMPPLRERREKNHHITNTAKALGLERSHLYKKCQALGISLRERDP